MMKVVTSRQMKALDKRTISEFDIPGEVLMDRAGQGIAEIVQHMVRLAGFSTHPSIYVFAGHGNNGGDGFVAARYLKEHGFPVEVWLAGHSGTVGGDARTHLMKMKSAGVPLQELPDKEDWDDALKDAWPAGGIVVDAVLGTGIGGPARGPAAGAIQYMRALADMNLIISVDVPSGLNADTGKAEGGGVSADITATMGLPKIGFTEPSAMDFVGSLEVVDIGIPDELIREIESEREIIVADDLRALFPRRPRHSHKGTYGKLLILGGAAGFAGAAALAARAAARSGAGLVTALVPSSIASAVTLIGPEVMVHPARETEIGSLSRTCLDTWPHRISDFDAVLIGPGLTTHPDSVFLVEKILQDYSGPLVMDADALNVCANRLDILRKAPGSLVLTPHPGEMARLLSLSVPDIQKARMETAVRAADETGAVVVLKGAGTIVARSGQIPRINLTGNPGMARGGCGDVLAGLTAGLLAQGLAPMDAASAAVYLHGRAGDIAAWNTSQAGMIAGDIVEEIPHAFREIAPR